MSACASQHSQATQDIDFDGFFCQYLDTARREAARQVDKYGNRMDPEDVDDISMLAMHKLYRAYFAPTAKRHYSHYSDAQAKALVRKAVEHAAIDWLRGQDDALRYASRLDESLAQTADIESALTRGDKLAADDDVCTEVVAKLCVEKVLEKIAVSQADGIKSVTRYLWGECSREDLGDKYDGNYVRVTTFNLKRDITESFDAG